MQSGKALYRLRIAEDLFDAALRIMKFPRTAVTETFAPVCVTIWSRCTGLTPPSG